MIDDETTLPPLDDEADQTGPVQILSSAYAEGDFRYHFTFMTVTRDVDGSSEIVMLGEHRAARFRLDENMAGRVASELERILGSWPHYPEVLHELGLVEELPPPPPPAPEAALYTPFPAISIADDPQLRVRLQGSRIELRVRAQDAFVYVTLDEPVAIWLQRFLKEPLNLAFAPSGPLSAAG
jgi:hypothetical protein